MMGDRDSGTDPFRDRLRSSDQRPKVILRAMVHHLDAIKSIQAREAVLPQAATLTSVLNAAARQDHGIPDDAFVEFATSVIVLMGALGVADFGRHDEVREAIDAAVSRFKKSGTSTIPLLLAKATFV